MDAEERERPLYKRVSVTCSHYGISRAHLYLLLASGEVRAVKAGSRTLVNCGSVEAWLGSLPRAEFRAARRMAG